MISDKVKEVHSKLCLKKYLNDSMTGTRQLQDIPITAISRVLIYRKHRHTNMRNQFATSYRRSDGNAGTDRYDVDLPTFALPGT